VRIAIAKLGRLLRTLATLLLTGAVLWLVAWRFGGGTAFAAIIAHADAGWVGVAVLASSACTLVGAERWRLVLKAMGYDLSFRRSLEVVLATSPLAMVTPSRASDLLRPVAVRDVIPLPAATGSVLAEKAIDLLVLLLMATAGAAVQGLGVWAACIGALAVAEIAVIAAVMTHRRALEEWPLLRRRRQAVEDLFAAIVTLRRAHPARLFATVMASVAMRVLTTAISHSMLVAVGARVRMFDTLTLWPAATLVGLAPLTLAGIGTRDAAFIDLLAERGAHADSSQVLAATVGYSAVAIALFAVVGIPFMIRESLRLRRG
jgi:uncharacterized protein (TIRG00374 family)